MFLPHSAAVMMKGDPAGAALFPFWGRLLGCHALRDPPSDMPHFLIRLNTTSVTDQQGCSGRLSVLCQVTSSASLCVSG